MEARGRDVRWRLAWCVLAGRMCLTVVMVRAPRATMPSTKPVDPKVSSQSGMGGGLVMSPPGRT